jgi:hypothetical protein
MSESFPAGSRAVPASKFSCDDLALATEPAMPLEASLEQARAVSGALNFLAALIAFYGEVVERGELDDGGMTTLKRSRLQ